MLLLLLVGEELLFRLKTCIYEGKGNFVITGMVGKVMEESTNVALSYIKSQKNSFPLNEFYFNIRDIHIHFLEEL